MELGEAGEPRGDGGASSRQCSSYRPRFRVEIGASGTYACLLMTPCIGCSPLAREAVEIDDVRMPTCRGGDVATCALPLHRPFERFRRAIQKFDTRALGPVHKHNHTFRYVQPRFPVPRKLIRGLMKPPPPARRAGMGVLPAQHEKGQQKLVHSPRASRGRSWFWF